MGKCAAHILVSSDCFTSRSGHSSEIRRHGGAGKLTAPPPSMCGLGFQPFKYAEASLGPDNEAEQTAVPDPQACAEIDRLDGWMEARARHGHELRQMMVRPRARSDGGRQARSGTGGAGSGELLAIKPRSRESSGGELLVEDSVGPHAVFDVETDVVDHW